MSTFTFSTIKPYFMQTDLFERLQRIDRLIQIKGTGNAAELADKLGLSRASVYEYINLMKDLGAPIKFCKFRQSFYYDEDGSFITRFLPNNKIGNRLKGANEVFA
jgi:predicted DNA-binding transcriptional regulator YafY